MGLGDLIHHALSSVGVTTDRVERWLGAPCGCEERREKLNRLSNWAKRVAAGKISRAEEWLGIIIGRDENNQFVGEKRHEK